MSYENEPPAEAKQPGFREKNRDARREKARQKEDARLLRTTSTIFNDPVSPAYRIYTEMQINTPYSFIDLWRCMTGEPDTAKMFHPDHPDYSRLMLFSAIGELVDTNLIEVYAIEPPDRNGRLRNRYEKRGPEGFDRNDEAGMSPGSFGLDQIIDVDMVDTADLHVADHQER